MAISVKNFEKRFKKIFGDEIWDDFIEYKRNNNHTEIFDSLQEVVTQLIAYSNKYDGVSNFYEQNKPFTRFVLISIERAFRPHSRSIKFNKKQALKKGNFNRVWEIEHIFPSRGSNSFNEIIKVPKKTNSCPKKDTNNNKLIIQITSNSICNLTLISRKLNGKEEYKKADFQKKKDIMNSPKYKEKDFYINRIFKNQSAKSSKDYFRLLLYRQLKLKVSFNRVFKPNKFGIPIIFFKEVLKYSEGNIKSTFHITHPIRKWCRKRRRIK